MRKNSVVFVVFAIFGLLLFNCATTGPGGKKSLILIGTKDEVAIGQNFAKEAESQNKVTPDTIWGIM
jgi:hypothetical protein